jgi:AraC-like DNA-binding protein
MENVLPSLDTWTSIFLLAAGQGFFLTVLLWQRYRRQQLANAWLAALVLAFSLLLVFNVGFWTRYNWLFPPFNLIYPAAAYLIGPFLLFYLDGLTGKPLFRAHRWLHFLPAALVLALSLPAYLQPLADLQAAMQEHQIIIAPLHRWGMNWLVSPAFITTHLLLYAGLVFAYSHRLLSRAGAEQQHRLKKRIRPIRTFFALYTFAFVAYYVLVRMAFFRIEHDYAISLLMAGAIYYIGYREYHLAGLRGDGGHLHPAAAKYSTSSLTRGALVSITQKLEAYMLQSHPYRNNQLRLNDLAEALGLSPHHLSQAINEHYNKTFNQFINEYRIAEARQLLRQEAYRQTYIIEIAYQVGFNNKTTFNQAFKNQTGMSPSEWRRQPRLSSSNSSS